MNSCQGFTPGAQVRLKYNTTKFRSKTYRSPGVDTNGSTATVMSEVPAMVDPCHDHLPHRAGFGTRHVFGLVRMSWMISHPGVDNLCHQAGASWHESKIIVLLKHHISTFPEVCDHRIPTQRCLATLAASRPCCSDYSNHISP